MEGAIETNQIKIFHVKIGLRNRLLETYLFSFLKRAQLLIVDFYLYKWSAV